MPLVPARDRFSVAPDPIRPRRGLVQLPAEPSMAQPLTVTISHNLTKQEAVRRLQNGIARIRNKGGIAGSIEDEWTGDKATFKATALFQTVSGRVEVMDNSVRVEVDLPWLLSRISEKVRHQIEQRGTKMLNKPKA